MKAISGPTMCLAWAYWPPAAATVEVTSEVDHGDRGVEKSDTQQTMRAASVPPLSAEKFQPVIFADENDADAQRPDMGRAQNPEQ